MIRFLWFLPFLFLFSGCILSPGPRIRADIMLAKVADADSRFIDETNDSLIIPAVEYYRRHGPRSLYAWSLYYLGRLRYNAGDYNGAILSYALASETRLYKSDYSFRGFVCSGIAEGVETVPRPAVHNSELLALLIVLLMFDPDRDRARSQVNVAGYVKGGCICGVIARNEDVLLRGSSGIIVSSNAVFTARSNSVCLFVVAEHRRTGDIHRCTFS